MKSLFNITSTIINKYNNIEHITIYLLNLYSVNNNESIIHININNNIIHKILTIKSFILKLCITNPKNPPNIKNI